MPLPLENKTVATVRITSPSTRASLIDLVTLTGAKTSPALEALLNEWPHLPREIQERVKARALDQPIPSFVAKIETSPQLPSAPAREATRKVERPNSRARWKESAQKRFSPILALWDQGKTIPEIATALGTTPKGIRNRISRARTQWGLFKLI